MIPNQSARRTQVPWRLLSVLALWLTAGAPALAQERMVTLTTRPGVTVSMLLTAPAGPPKAVVVLLAGGDGAVGVGGQPDAPKLRAAGNFLVRSRAEFARNGLLAAVVDVPSDHSGGMNPAFRAGPEHAADLGAVVAHLKAQAGAPVWLVGTSMGTISAAGAAIHLGHAIDGVVLSSIITRLYYPPRGGVSGLELDKVVVPVMLVGNDRDQCEFTPSDEGQALADRLTASPRVGRKRFNGGDLPRGPACEAYSYHGFLGIEAQVVDAIAEFILAGG